VADFTPLGRTGLKQAAGSIREEFHPRLAGRKAAKVYTEIRDNDATAGAALHAIDTLVRQVPWIWSASGQDTGSLAALDFARSLESDLSQSWSDLISEIFSELVFGWSYFEVCLKPRSSGESAYNDGRIGLRKIEIRAQESLDRWQLDDDGGIRGLVQTLDRGTVFLPIERCALFRTQSAKNNPEGRSLLRNAYRSWYLLKRLQEIEAIGHERNLAGLPVLEVPPAIMDPNAAGVEASTRAELEKLVQEIRTDERMGLLIPSELDADGKPTGYRFRLLSTGGRDLTAIGGAIDRYRREIAATFNANFLTIGEGAGSYALDKNKTSFFILTLYTLLGGVRDTLQRFVFDRVFDLNSIPIALRPTLSHGKIAASSLEETATYLSSLAGFVQPRAELEDQLLRAADLPVPERAATNESDTGTPLAQQIGVGGTQSLVEIVRNVHERQIPAESGIKMIVALFGLPEDQAAAIVGEVSDEVTPDANA